MSNDIPHLSDFEICLLYFLSKGWDFKEMAQALGLKHQALCSPVNKIYLRCGVSRGAQWEIQRKYQHTFDKIDMNAFVSLRRRKVGKKVPR